MPKRGMWLSILRGAKGLIILPMAFALPSSHAADDSDASMFSFSGFGTVGVVHSNEHNADFVAEDDQPKGAGFTRRWSATPDTKFGLQLTANFTDRLSGVVQVVSRYRYDATYIPDVTWANLKFKLTPDFSVRLGRIANPIYLYSDSSNVGYVMPNVRIPWEIYGQVPVTGSDGVDFSYQYNANGVTDTVQAYFGQSKQKLFSAGTYDIHHLRGIANTLEYGPATLHVSYQKLDYDLSLGGFQFNSKDPQSILNIGGIYDPGDWFVVGEWIRAPDEQTGLYDGWYALGGVRINKFTPYGGYARTYRTDVGSGGYPPGVYQNTTTLGLRWDFMRNVDLKLQLERVKLYPAFSYFFNQQPGFNEHGKINLFTIAVDFVF